MKAVFTIGLLLAVVIFWMFGVGVIATAYFGRADKAIEAFLYTVVFGGLVLLVADMREDELVR